MEVIKVGDIIRYREWKPGDYEPVSGLTCFGDVGIVIDIPEKYTGYHGTCTYIDMGGDFCVADLKDLIKLRFEYE